MSVFPKDRFISCRTLLVVIAGIVLIPMSGWSKPTLECEMIPIVGEEGYDLGGKFLYVVSATGTEPLTVTSEILVLDRIGNILRTLPIDSGDIVHWRLRDKVIILEKGQKGIQQFYPNTDDLPEGNLGISAESIAGPGHVRWMVSAPGIMIRAKAEELYEWTYAYCSPYAAIRVDKPDNMVFSSSPLSGDAPVPLIVGVTQMKPDQIKLLVDCVDILGATGAVLPGGPFSGTAEIAGETVTIEDLIADFDNGTISFTLLNLPGGSHKVAVSGVPVYIDTLPPGWIEWNRPLGALEHEAEFHVFRADITFPENGDHLPSGPVDVQGVIVHGQSITSLRVYGKNVALPPEEVIPGDECVGDVHRIEFSVPIPTADLGYDFETGGDELSAFDPGVNFTSIIAADGGNNTSSDRVRFVHGDVETPNLGSPMPGSDINQHLKAYECNPQPSIDGYATNGFAASLSEAAVADRARELILPQIVPPLVASLQSLEGQTVEGIINPCDDKQALIEKYLYDNPEFFRFMTPMDYESYAPNPSSRSVPVPNFGLKFNESNTPPELTPIGDQSVVRTQLLRIELSASDADGDELTFSVIDPPANSELNDNIFEFLPACNQLGDYIVTFVVSDGTDTDEETITISVEDGNTDLPINPRIEEVHFDPNTVDLEVSFPSDDLAQAKFITGPIAMDMHWGKCLVDCWLFCCFHVSVDFQVAVSGVEVTADLTPENLYCGVEDASEINYTADLGDVAVDFETPSISGPLAWLTPLGLVLLITNEFVGERLLDTYLAPYAADLIEDELNDAMTDYLPSLDVSFAGLQTVQFETDLPEGIPLSLSVMPADLPVITEHGSITVGMHTDFNPDPAKSPEPSWAPTTSAFAKAENFSADLLLEVSDDALNQMMAALTSTDVMRGGFSGFTLGDLAGPLPPELLAMLAFYGIDESTPILITLDAAQDPDGNAIPPIMGFVDDAGTTPIEMIFRVQLLTRGIFERGTPVAEDRDLCACTDLSADCLGEPCVIHEAVLKLNLLTSCTMSGGPPDATILTFVVTEIQQLARGEGFNAYEMTNLEASEDEIVTTSAESDLLYQLMVALNNNLPPMSIPADAVTLGGYLDPVNLRLVTAQVDNAGFGVQDYFGIAADINPAKDRTSWLANLNMQSLGNPTRSRDDQLAGNQSDQTEDIDRPDELSHAEIRNFPNPFNLSTVIRFNLPASTPYELAIYNVLGQRVRLFSGTSESGTVELVWDGKDEGGNTVPSGIYLYQLRNADWTRTRKMILIK